MKKRIILFVILALVLSISLSLSLSACKIAVCEHEWENSAVSVEATCTTVGSQEQICTKCGSTQSIEISALGHDLKPVSSKDATCTESGFSAYEQCSRCDYNTKGDDLPKLDHSFGDEWKSDDNGHWHECVRDNCTVKSGEGSHADNNNDHECDDCKYVMSDCKSNAVPTVKKDATCTEDGYEAYWTCSVCSKKYSDVDCMTELENIVVIPAFGHNFTAETVHADYLKSEANCQSAAIYYKSCANCGLSSVGVAGKEATFTNGEKDSSNHSSEEKEWVSIDGAKHKQVWKCCGATIIEEAHEIGEDGICTKCKEGCAHSLIIHYEGKEATCTEDGYEAYWTCSVCSKKYSDVDCMTELENIVVIPAFGHNFTAETVHADYLKSEANCQSAATYYKSCANCGLSSVGVAGKEATFTNGEKDSSNHSSEEKEWVAIDGTKHKQVWKCCGATIIEEAHEIGEDGICTKCKEGCAHSLIIHYEGKEATCTEDGNVEYWTCTDCKKNFSDEECTTIISGSVTISALGHNIVLDTTKGVDGYTWADDYSSCTAHGKCDRTGCTHTEDADATVSSSVTTEKDCINDEMTTYTATFDASITWTTTQTNEVKTADKLGHNIVLDTTKGVDGYTWADDYSSCTAHGKCDRQGCTHTEDADATVSSSVTTEKDCINDEMTTYTATFDASITWTTTQTNEVKTADKLGHNIVLDTTKGVDGYTWADDYSSCTAHGKCDRQGCTHTEDADATITPSLKQAQSCINDEIYDYTATFTVDWAETKTLSNIVSNSALGHTYGKISYAFNDEYTAFTATRSCSECVESVDGHTQTATSTSHVIYAITKQPTCTEAGEADYLVYFGVDWISDPQTVSARLQPNGHTIKFALAKDATCTKDGNIEHWTCTDCKKNFSDEECTNIISESVTISALGHNIVLDTTKGVNGYTWADDYSSCTAHGKCDRLDCTHTEDADATLVPNIIQNATCTLPERSDIDYSFSVSWANGDRLDLAQTKPALGHDFDTKNWSIDDANGHYHACKRDNCNEKDSLTPHTFENGICSECGDYDIYGTEGLVYSFSSSKKTYSVTEYNGTETEVRIPPYYNNGTNGVFTVTSVVGFFQKDITAISLPNTITTILGGAFGGSKLTSISIPDSVTSIGSCAFESCTYLATIDYPDNLYNVSDRIFHNTAWYNNQPDGIIYLNDTLVYGYKGVNGSLEIKDGATVILPYAFSSNSDITGVIIPDSVKIIGKWAFNNARNLKSIVIGATNSALESFERQAASGADSLGTVTFKGTYEAFKTATENGSALDSYNSYYWFTNIGANAKLICNDEIVVISATAKDPTCTERGNISYYYNILNGKYYTSKDFKTEINENVFIDITEHTFGEWTDEVLATCTSTGTKGHKDCSVCGKHFDTDGKEIEELTNSIDSTAHNYGEWSSNNDGTHSRTCSYNSEHIETVNCSGGSATCTVQATCSVCSEPYGDLAAHNYGEWTDEVLATCTSTGTKGHKDCSVCGKHFDTDGKEIEELTNSIDSTAHNYGEWSSNNDGTHSRTCSYNSEHIETVNCSGGSATCTVQATCSVCSEPYGDLDAHTFDQEKAEDKYLASAATCTANVTYYKSCSCGLSSKDTEDEATFEKDNSALGHIDGNKDHSCDRGCGASVGTHEGQAKSHDCLYCGKPASEHTGGTATCTQKAKCTICGDEYNDVLGHDVSNTTFARTEWTHWNECSRCGDKFNEAEHNYQETPDPNLEFNTSVCTGCNLVNNLGTEGLVYKYVAKSDSNPESYYIVTGYTGTATEVRIPYWGQSGEYLSKRVKYIDYRAFYGNSRITKVVLPTCLVEIGERAFYSCPALAEVEITSGNIRSYAFSKCTALTEINVPGTIEEGAFDGCTSLTTVKLYSGVFRIPNSAFLGCSSLSTIEYNYRNSIVEGLPSNIVSIGDYAFSGCTSLLNVDLPSDLESLGIWAFQKTAIKSVTIPSKITEIPKFAFANCSQLATITIHNNVTKYGDSAFENCALITTVPFPSKITHIGNHAFAGTAIKSVHIPATVTTILSSAFSDCKSLTSLTFASGINLATISAFIVENTKVTTITIPDSVTAISGHAFWESKLTTINISTNSKLTSIGDSAFNNCTQLKSIYIPKGVTEIGWRAFYYCENLETVTFAANSELVTIDEEAFFACYKLKSMVIPKGVTSIPNSAFVACREMTSVTLPSNLTSIGVKAFASCSVLSSISIPSGINTIGDMAFSNCLELKSVTVPSGTKLGNGVFANCPKIQLTLTGKGDLVFKNGMLIDTVTKTLQIVTYTDSKFVLPDDGSITTIGSYAFYGSENLVELVMSESIESFGDHAFAKCPNLKSVTFSSKITTITDYAFAYSGIESIVIPSTIETVGRYAFAWSKCLYSVTFEGVPTFSWGSFDCCYALAELIELGGDIKYGDSYAKNYSAFVNKDGVTKVTKTGDFAFVTIDSDRIMIAYTGTDTDIVIPSGTTHIKSYAMAYNDKITSLVIPEGVVSIGDFSFCGLKSMTSVTLPTSLKSMGARVFSDCLSLESINLPEGLESIGRSAFQYCPLRHITIPSTVTTMGDEMLASNEYLESITLPFVGLSIDGTEKNRLLYLFSVSSINIDKTKFYQVEETSSSVLGYYIPLSLKTVTITGESIIRGFSSFTSIETVYAPNGTSIGDFAFSDCTSLTEVVYPTDTLTSIGKYAFRNCTSLSGITLPLNVGTMGQYIFEGCTSLDYVVFPRTVEKAIPRDSFGMIVNNLYYNGTMTDYLSLSFAAHNTLSNFANNVYLLQPNGSYAPLTGEVVIPEDVKSIGNYAFYGYQNITNIVIPEGVESIGASAFADCTGLTEIEFKGTMDQWNAIKKGADWNKNVTATIICTDGTI